MITNSKGTVYYGMHFYPGVAEYKNGGEAFRVFLNEDTIRSMGPSFAGRPVYVMHVDDVPEDLDDLRAEADGWVIESFYNEADGKHWAKFLVVSDRARSAIEKGYRLSNCYHPKAFGNGGEWNGVSYQKEVKGGEYEHLAIVPNPRYEESVVLTPEAFKAYNEAKRIELQRLANDNGGTKPVKLNLFKRTKVENASDLENTLVLLPKSGREVTILKLVNEADEAEEKKKGPRFANEADLVKIGDKEVSVKDLVSAYIKNEDVENEDDDDKEDVENEDDDDKEDVENEDDDKEDVENENDDKEDVENEDDDAVKAKKEEEEKKKNKKVANSKADKLRNAHKRGNFEDRRAPVYDPTSGAARGKARYGS